MISQDHVNQYNDEGYTIVENLFPMEELQPVLNEFEDIVDQSVPIIMHFKNKFDRRRPFVVDMNLNILPSSTNDTPSYPSGHSTQSRLIARYVAGKFPEHEIELLKKGDECGVGRVKAGFHYPSDNEAGILLGEKLYVFLNKENYED